MEKELTALIKIITGLKEILKEIENEVENEVENEIDKDSRKIYEDLLEIIDRTANVTKCILAEIRLSIVLNYFD